MKKFAATLPIFLALPIFLFSQNKNASDTLGIPLSISELTPVTVTAYRLEENEMQVPLAVSRIGEFRLQRGEQQLTLNDALVTLPGVYVQNSENFNQDLRVSIRGFGSRSNFGIRGVKVLQDGFPETTPDGQGQVDNIDPSSVIGVEAIRGATAGLYGNASGGYLNFQTLDFTERSFAEGGVKFGSFGFQKTQVRTGGPAGKMRYSLSASHLRRDGYRENGETESTLLNGGLRIPLDSTWSLTVALNYVNSPTANDPGGLTQEQVGENPQQARPGYIDLAVGERVEQGRVGIFLEKKFAGGNKLSLRSWHTRRDFKNNLSFAVGEIKRQFTGGQMAWEHTGTLLGRPWSMSLGTELEHQLDKRKQWQNVEGIKGNQTAERDERFTNWGTYLVQKWQVLDIVHLHGSLRYDRMELAMDDPFLSEKFGADFSDQRSYDAWNPLVGISFTFSPQLNVYGNYSTAFETPTLNELVADAGDVFIQNLVPQKSQSIELGAKGTLFSERLRYELALFSIRADNEIVPFLQVDGGTLFENVGNTERTGLELGLGSRLAKDFYGYLSFTLSEFVFENDTMQYPDLPNGSYLPGVPRQHGYAELRYQPSTGLFGSARALYVGEQFAENENFTRVKPYWLLHLRAGYAVQHRGFRAQFFAGVNNLLDVDYFSNLRINDGGWRYFEPGVGRNWVVGVSFEVQNQGATSN